MAPKASDTESEGLPPEQEPEHESEPQADKITRLKARLCQIWHLPDHFHWMSPLPLFHRRWLFVALAVLLLALIWPSSSDTPPQPVSLGFSPDGQVVQETAQDNQNNNPDWQHFQIQAGETLAQLFRNNRLTVNDVFAMAQVEGPDKPLSNLKAGQQINLQQDATGTVTALEVVTTDNKTVRFARQPNGGYLRTR